MAIQETILGGNTSSFYWDAGTTMMEMQLAIKAFLITHGWEALDTTPVDGGTYLRQGYRALNQDGVTYKYMVVHNNVATIKTYVYEEYDPDTQVGTNTCTQSDIVTISTILDVDGILWISANSKWCLMQQFSNGIYGTVTYNYGFVGAFELKLLNERDTGCAHGYTSGMSITGAQSSNYYSFASPRLHDGSTGTNSSAHVIVNTAIGSWGAGLGLANSALQGQEYPLDLTSYHAYDMSIITQEDNDTKRMVRGPIYGLKAFSWNIGSMGNIVSVKCNSEGFIDPNGTPTDHLLVTSYNYRFIIPL